MYREQVHIKAQEEIEAEGIDNFDLWERVVRDCYASRNPAYNVGKPLHFYRQRKAAEARARAPSGGRRSNVESGLEAVNSYIAKVGGDNAKRAG